MVLQSSYLPRRRVASRSRCTQLPAKRGGTAASDCRGACNACVAYGPPCRVACSSRAAGDPLGQSQPADDDVVGSGGRLYTPHIAASNLAPTAPRRTLRRPPLGACGTRALGPATLLRRLCA
ncbi:hypothetical protein HPB50_005071 [Hyalomma asiaticum]|uniref:Uncharacterized protein n=1 Tax=Hyalomma asiaticum TaxID=266040 RepID=A0ACB7SRL5_HYAAI|nr:hypothetical protein HPB50_005071 [Hyalomma asiaticum]